MVLHMENTISFIDDSITISGRSTDEKEQGSKLFCGVLVNAGR